MKGFLKRDLCLFWYNCRQYIIFVAVMGVVSVFKEAFASFAGAYSALLVMGVLMNLFAYDDANQWQSYAAAAPGGRKAMVNARYGMSGLLCLMVVGLILLMCLAGRRSSQLGEVSLYGGLCLLYGAVLIPICYRFGGIKGRTVMILVVGMAAAGMAMLGMVVALSTGFGQFLPTDTSLLVLLVGLAGQLLSYRISLAIVKRKEF